MPSLGSTAELPIQNACSGAPEPALPAGSWMQASLLLLGPHFENRSPGSPSWPMSSPERQEPEQRRGYAELPTPGECGVSQVGGHGQEDWGLREQWRVAARNGPKKGSEREAEAG